ncbi:MAG: hypothetical protein ABSE73_14970 [Planctomycetota bacterium]
MAQKKHNGWERKRVRLIQDKLFKRATEKQAEKKKADVAPPRVETVP